LTEEEKKEKLAELKQKAIERRTLKEKVDREEAKKNEVRYPQPWSIPLLHCSTLT
jgi:hypothetical protein